tara:strand:- start:3106 stop:3822 length:717 start_codon:yes stop_codon:yes gene_type:complete
MLNNFIKNIRNTQNDTINIEKLNFIEGELIIVKNFLNDTDLITLEKIMINILLGESKTKTVYFHTSTGWHPYFIPHFSQGLSSYAFFNEFILSKIQKLVPSEKPLRVKRIYVSFQTAGQHGNWHVDDGEKDTYTFTLYYNIKRSDGIRDNEKIACKEKYESIIKSCIINDDKNEYLNKINNSDNVGYFNIKYSDQKPIFIRTETNTAVFFDSKMIHNGDCNEYSSTNLRCVIAYKLFK